ncbi:MAG TPA: flagellar basal-body MS-ring/collar protein FliF [Paracoccaceae bacterium]|nr:flagellar basal-body MS-ring/collar protein FliF [Paracoccaceae bacterium]HMO72964.1 flagellar basal-body MS-ring/collar protein FliF [Paracoccaceae bacterium]
MNIRRCPTVQNLAEIWSRLDIRRRIVVVAATVGMFLAVIGLARAAAAPGMALLYSGLDPAAAGQVVAALEQRGIAYQVAGDSIRVDASRRDETRMLLAAEGLPAVGAAGYELLDGLSGFGTTAQMFDAAFWRAREGELARTILSLPGIRAARVHIAAPPGQPFLRDRRATASVTLTMTGSAVTATQARALRHLVSAAVTGLAPEDVAIVDGATGLVGGPDERPFPGAEPRAAEIRRSVERLLEARVGPGKAVVEVSIDLSTEREAITERRFDPQGRVAISSETEERSTSGSQGGGEVTVASNLPEGDTSPGAAGRSRSTETRERVNFEVSETSRELLRTPGAVRRQTVAVLVDGILTPGPDGTPVWQPRPEAELTALRDLVASAVGLDEARGDVLTLHSLEFRPGEISGTTAEVGLLPGMGPLDTMVLIQMVALALVALVLGLFVLRPLMQGRRPAVAAEPQMLAPPHAAAALPGLVGATATPAEGSGGLRVLTGEIDDDLAQSASDVEAGRSADPVERLRRLIEERRSESVEILRGWMDAADERI